MNSVVQPQSIETLADAGGSLNADRTSLKTSEIRPCVARLPQTDSSSFQTSTGSLVQSVESPLPGPALQQEMPYTVPPQGQSAPAELPRAEEIPTPKAGASYQLDMSTALALVAGQNPQVGFARARVREAYANLEAANVLWLPTIQSGVSFNHHEGTLQDSAGAILAVSRSSLQTGLGAGAVGAGTTPQPGLVAQFQMIDAIFQPKIAERTMSAQQHASNAVLNNQLLEAAVAYQELLRAYQLQAVAKESTESTETLARQTEEFAKVGQGTLADADRSNAELALRRNAVARSEEQVAVAAARLAQAIGIRDSQNIQPVESAVTPIELVCSNDGVQDALATALARRPEFMESQDLVAAACERLRREKYAPLVPSVLLGASYTGFGGGTGDTIGDFRDRADFDAIAVWQIRNLGFGEEAARSAAGARVQQARMREIQLMDLVAREVTEAQARLTSRRNRIKIAQAGIQVAKESLTRNSERIRGGQGLPIEVLQAIQSLDAVEREFVDSVVDYNIAQFQLQRALGWPIGVGSPEGQK